MKKNKQSNLFCGLLVFLCIIFIWLKIPIIGLLCLSAVFLYQARFFSTWILRVKKINLGFLSYYFILSFYVIGLSLVYYLFGLSRLSISVFLLFIGIAPLLLRIENNFIWPIIRFDWLLQFKNSWNILVSAVLLFFLAWLGLNPIINGSPTPWIGIPWPAFIIFALISLFLLRSIFSRQLQPGFFSSWVYLFFIVAIVPLRYVLSFGYDTLIHQGALAEIAANGRVFPLTPFYVGQYSLEILLNFVSGFSFVFIERWLVPLFFALFVGFIGRYLLKKFVKNKNFFIVPLVVLLFLPAAFSYTTPYSFALVFSLASVAFTYIYLRQQKGEFFWAALAMALVAILVHPFVGLNVLIAVWLAKNFPFSGKRIKVFKLSVLFIAISLTVVAAFAAYNWIGGKIIYLTDPGYYLNNFLSIFSSPSWYVFEHPAWWLLLIYFYEKLSIFLVFIFGCLFVLRSKKDNSAGIYIFILALGAFVSAWLFMSGIEVEGYSIGDQVNYSSRLLASAKWFLFFLALLFISEIFSWLSKKTRTVKISAAIGIAILLTASLYLTYPRNDEISRLGVNNIRAVDYKIIDTIREREGGKEGYLVFANQLFGGAAIQKYGFGPYYKSPWGELFYYSTPMASENNKRFNRIMDEDVFNPELIFETLRETGVDRAYLVITDYWPLRPSVEVKVSSYAKEIIKVGEGNFIYIFSLK